MSNKIAIIGAQDSAKTTSLYYSLYMLKKNRAVLGIGHEVARECPYPISDKSTFVAQLWILFKQIERETLLHSYYDNIILDRSVYDSIPYTHALFEDEKITVSQHQFITSTVFGWTKVHPYSMLIFLKPMDLEDDPARGENTRTFQSRIAKHFEDIIYWVPRGTKVHIIDQTPKEERCLEVYRLIRDKLNLQQKSENPSLDEVTTRMLNL